MTEPKDQQSIAALISAIVDDIRTLISDQIALVKAELRASVRSATAGAGFFGAAILFVVIATFFLVMALVHGLNALGLPMWASYLAVGGTLVLTAVIFVVIGIRAMKKVKAPTRSINQFQETVDSLHR